MPESQHVRSTLDVLSTQLLDLTTALKALQYISGAKVGADLTFTVNATSSGCLVTQTIARPAAPRDNYEFLIHNPSSQAGLHFDLFTVTSALAAADRNAFLTSFETTPAVCSGPSTYDCVRQGVSGTVFGGGDLKVIMYNLAGSTGYTGVGGTTDLDVAVRLVEFI